MRGRRIADVIVETLEAAGVQRCWGIPGDTLNHFTDALRKSRIRFVHVRHEETAGFAAGTEALLTGALTVCAGSCGPGSLHFINGLYESHRNRAPVLLIASQIHSDETGTEFPQEVDFKSVYRGASVYCEEVHTALEARRRTVMAAQAALVKRGVAVLVVPVDVSTAEVGRDLPYSVHAPKPLVRPSDADLDRLAELLNEGRKVAIYGGSGCEHAHDEVVALADRLQAPVAHTSRAKDFLEPSNPFDVGMTGLFGIESGFASVMECDTLLLLGCDFAWRQFYPAGAKILQVDLDGTHLGRRHPVTFGVVGDVRETVAALLPRIRSRTDSEFLRAMLRRKEAAMAQLGHPAAIDPRGIIHPQYVVRLLAQLADRDAIFTADGGGPMVWLLRHLPSTGANRTFTSLTHGTMANAMPQALGAQMAFPKRQVIALSGDGGLAMLLGDLLTAVQEKLPIKVVVFDNGTLGFVELEQRAEGMLDAYTKLENPDFARVAEAMGFTAWRVTDPNELEARTRELLAAPGPALLDVVLDRSEFVVPPKLEAGQVLGMALYSAKAVLAGRGHDVVEMIEDNLHAT